MVVLHTISVGWVITRVFVVYFLILGYVCSLLKENSHQKRNVANNYDRATPEKFFSVSLAHIRSLKGYKKAG